MRDEGVNSDEKDAHTVMNIPAQGLLGALAPMPPLPETIGPPGMFELASGGGGGGTDQRKGETIKSAPLKGSWACSGDDSALVDFRKKSACGPCGTKIIFDDAPPSITPPRPPAWQGCNCGVDRVLCGASKVMLNSDTVSLYQLSLSATIGPDVWQRTRPQPVLITIHAHTSLVPAGNTDNVADSIHYGHLATTLRNLEHTSFSSLIDLAHAVADEGLKYPSVHSVHVLATAPKQLLHASSLAVELVKSAAQSSQLTLHINDLSLETIIGVNPPERVHKQKVVTTLSFLDPQCLPMVGRLTEVLPIFFP